MLRHVTTLLAASAIAGCATAGPQPKPPLALTQVHSTQVGLLVMAHGGPDGWNQTVTNAIDPLREAIPTVLALGMANPTTLRAGLDSLRDAGVGRVAVVRLFISGRSFFNQTAFLLGLSSTPPTFFIHPHGSTTRTASVAISHALEIATHDDGLMTSPQVEHIIADRAAELSIAATHESVLLLAHGMGDDRENERLLVAMRGIGDRLADRGFETVHVATLREDWPDKRQAAVRDIRAFVHDETQRGRRVLVLPFRLSGFGPYADVLAGLPFHAGRGLLPHAEITSWMQHTASTIICAAGWHNPIAPCAPSITSPR